MSSSLRDLTFTSTELRDLKLRGPFSLVAPNFINALGQKFPNCYPLPYFSKYFPNFRQGATEIDFNTFQFGKHSFSLALETGTMNNNVIINSTLLQPLVVSAAKTLRH